MKGDSEKIALTKVDVSKRLFKQAVILFFEQGDPVAIHHLSHAAHEILNKLTEKSCLYDSQLIKKEFRKKFNHEFNRSKNYIKHADRDKDGSLDFYPGVNDMLLLDCMLMILSIDVDFKPANAYSYWARLKYPECFKNDSLPEYVKQSGALPPDDYRQLVVWCKQE